MWGSHLSACVGQSQHVALSKVSVRAHDDHIHHQGQPAQEALQALSIWRLTEDERGGVGGGGGKGREAGGGRVM
jgi:hypothetical protein